MSIFVTGATGVLGRPVVAALSKQGYKIHALCRSPDNRKRIIQQGAIPEEVDLYDVDALTELLETCDTVLHLATRIPPSSSLKKPGIWDINDKIRRDGTASLVEAAQAAGTIRTVLYPGISFFYGDGGSNWLHAGNAATEPVSFLRSTLDAEASVSNFAADDKDRRAIVLRFGAFYGPGSKDSRQSLDMARKGFHLPLAEPATYRSMIWIDDAAQAVVRGLENAPSGIYDVVEDKPFTQKQAAEALAASVGRQRLHTIPRILLRLALPGDIRGLLNRSHRISNRQFRDATGWAPDVPSQAEGWRRLADAVHKDRISTQPGRPLPHGQADPT